jgi:hypothetical protein
MSQFFSDKPETNDIQPPAWFAEYQEELGQLLRTPLQVVKQQFRAPIEAYSRTFVAQIVNDGPGSLARLALYHEQYWRRLFNTFQSTFPRTAKAIGYFEFNQVALQFLAQHPSQSFDLGNSTDGFFSWLSDALELMISSSKNDSNGYRIIDTPLRSLPKTVDSSATVNTLGSVAAPWSFVLQALSLDEAERRAFRAAWEPLWEPSSSEKMRFRQLRFRYASSFSLLRLDYDLPLGRFSESQELSLERRKTPLHIVILRAQRSLGTYPLDPVFARLLALARNLSWGDAITQTERALPESLRNHLRNSVDTYADRALTRGFWTGIAT